MEDKTCPVTEQDLLIGGFWFWLVSLVHGVWLENEKTLFMHFKGIFAGAGCLGEKIDFKQSNFLKTSIFPNPHCSSLQNTIKDSSLCSLCFCPGGSLGKEPVDFQSQPSTLTIFSTVLES